MEFLYLSIVGVIIYLFIKASEGESAKFEIEIRDFSDFLKNQYVNASEEELKKQIDGLRSSYMSICDAAWKKCQSENPGKDINPRLFNVLYWIKNDRQKMRIYLTYILAAKQLYGDEIGPYDFRYLLVFNYNNRNDL